MPNDSIQTGDVQGNLHLIQAAGDFHGDAVARDKNVYQIQNLTIYLASRPQEPQSKPISEDIGPNPYKGLSAFQETDADHFFGREVLTRLLYEKFLALHEVSLPTLRLLAVLGPSGSGKSSLARAGLLPELARRPLPGKQKARVAVFTPGIRPLENLATILARIAANDPTPVAKKLEFTEVLQKRNAAGQMEGLRHIADALPDIDAAPLILLIDQFEEIYALCDNAEERRQFIANLLNAAGDRSGHVSVILTLRSDFLGQTQSHPDLNHAIASQGVIIPVMNVTELRQAIAKPAELAGHPLDDATIDLLIEQAKEREGALPLLQFALTRIWDGLAEGAAPAETLKRIGGVGGALAGEAQRLFDRLSDADKAIARRAFLGLVQLGEGTRDTRRRITLSEIVAHGEDPAHVQAIVRCFADPRARLVTLSAAPDGAETAEVTHEALLDHWDALREWLEASRDDLRFHRHLAEAAHYWETQNKPDGLLWRPPDLELLQQYRQRAGQDMTPLQVEFFQASARKEQHAKWLKCGVIAALLLFAAAAGIAAYLARQSGNRARASEQAAIAARNQAQENERETLRLYHVSFVQSLVTYADQHFYKGEREQAALLARQAYFLNGVYQANIEDQIKDVLRRTLALPEGESKEMSDQVCRQARRNLTRAEWQQVVQNEQIAYQPCSELKAPDEANFVYRLRRDPLTTAEVQHLSLYVRANGCVGTFIENRFEAQREGQVVFDRATGLTWQQSGSPDAMTYAEAEKYVESLNQGEGFAGHTDWCLPTVEELCSLVEAERQENGLYIDPIFSTPREGGWSWYWSADEIQIKDENSPGLAWLVNFDDSHVNWDYIDYYVRAVRSRQ